MTDDLVTRLDACYGSPYSVTRKKIIDAWPVIRDRLTAAEAERDSETRRADANFTLYGNAVEARKVVEAERNELLAALRALVNLPYSESVEDDERVGAAEDQAWGDARVLLARLRDRST